jgi:histidinol dehydrogenase
MGVIPAQVAGVAEVCVTSPPLPDGLPDRRILAAAALAGSDRCFALGGAQAIAAFAYGVMESGREIIPRADIIAGPGNKYVAWAKRRLAGTVAIEAVAGPTDVLIIAGKNADAEIVAADLIAQAEHDEDARARALVPNAAFAQAVEEAVARQLEGLPTAETAAASLKDGILIIYTTKDEAVNAANDIAPEHLELQVDDAAAWLPALKNYGSIFIGGRAAEALGDYSVGINHTLPTMGTSRFSGGLSVRHFLKIVTSLRVEDGAAGAALAPFLEAARTIADAEGLSGHARSLELRSTATQLS